LKRTFSPKRQALMPIFGFAGVDISKPLQDSCTN
jgi:hypothetical protein